ncbi:bifunctional diguanylate cyclase/phosphodiesterase [Luteimonas vadosa]|uniref:EAL domain-containing protein n=1 Tax=Luteimonas vadosa TaxID=1165507 RepID=A0ABP9E2G5_9GAMM
MEVVPDGESLAGALLRAITPEEVARILLEAGGAAAAGASVAWSAHWPFSIETFPPAVPGEVLRELRDAVGDRRAGLVASPNVHVMHDDGDARVAAVHCPAGCPSPGHGVLALTSLRMEEVLSIQHLQGTIEQLEQAELLQRSLYAIADMAGSDHEMPEMLRGLHRIVSELMYAENFYIALYDSQRDTLNFIYFVDTVDTDGPQPGEDVPLSVLERGLTWYLIREGKPLMGNDDELRAQVPGPVNWQGADSSDWLGVPMLRDGKVRGALVVQSYVEGTRYTVAEMSLLAFVAEHILTALERKQGRDELERHVAERTAQLAEANRELRHEVAERKRGERLQATLYRIAALAGLDESREHFYRHVHDSVGELINARNFFIALLSEDGEEVTFPYVRDEFERNWGARRRGRGLTEFVLRTGKAQLVDLERSRELLRTGDIDSAMVGTPTKVWLGVPLFDSNRAIGVVAVQDYESDEGYDDRDVELLTFASHQISSSLQRHRAAEQLRLANVELERRVEERTVELRAEIAVREQVEAKLQHQVMHDALTGLPNRSYLRDHLDRALSTLARDPLKGFALLYVDVDRFKVINDSLGHLAGDAVLKQVALRMGQCVRGPDIVSRLAGDEFAILLQGEPMPEIATKVARRVLDAFEAPLEVSGRSLQVSTSVGIAVVDGHYTAADQILHDADIALYRAKQAGRSRFELFDEVMQRNAMDVLDLEQGLRDALVRDEFEPCFQPLVRLDDGSTLGYEALLRWRHPQRGLLAPGDFLDVAEDSGLIEAIDWRMFHHALAASRELVGTDRYVTLNVSPRLFQREDFDVRMLALTSELDFDPARLRLEVTEGTLLNDPEAVVAVLHRLREANIEAALDDFGTGYSSLGHVHRFPLKMIKIDRSFVTPFAGSPIEMRSSAVIEAILALGKALGVEIVAEGIETEAQRTTLLGMGCELGQGYLFGRPAPASHWLASR